MSTMEQLRLAHEVLDEIADLVAPSPELAYRDPVPGAERTVLSAAAVGVGSLVVQPFVSRHIPGALLVLLEARAHDPWRDAVYVDLEPGSQDVTFLEQSRSGAMRTLAERSLPRRYDADSQLLPVSVRLAHELVAHVHLMEDQAA